MALFIGFLIFMLGLGACSVWPTEFLGALKGFTALSLLFWGLIAMIVGYSERKARREYQAATHDENPESENTL